MASADPVDPRTMPHVHRHHVVPLMLLCAAALGACGGEGESVLDTTHVQPPIPAPPTARPAPLGEADVALYLQVMRQATQRVQHPSAAEKQMLAQAEAITAAANRGDALTRDADHDDVQARALRFHMQMDLEIAKARRLDIARYQALSERIEDESGELYCNPAAAVPDPLLKPHVAEIEHLARIVRNPGPTGSASIPACAPADAGHS